MELGRLQGTSLVFVESNAIHQRQIVENDGNLRKCFYLVVLLQINNEVVGDRGDRILLRNVNLVRRHPLATITHLENLPNALWNF